MPLNKQHLTERELFVKTTNMVEQIVDAKISLVFARGMNFCNFDGYQNTRISSNGVLSGYITNKKQKNFTVRIAHPPEKHIKQYTALLHELGHILYESPFTPMKQLLENWNAPRLYYDIFNILEDQRIESHLTRSYIGLKSRFDKTVNDLGKAMKSPTNRNDPSFILLAIRFHRDDLVRFAKNYKIYKKAFDDIERTDKFGSLRVLISIRKYIEEFLSEQKGDRYYNNKNMSERPWSSDRRKLKGRPGSQKSDNTQNPPPEPDNPRSKHLLTSLNTPNSMDAKIPNELLESDYTDDEIDKIVNGGKMKGEKQFQKIRDTMLSIDRQDISSPHVKKISRSKEPYEIDKKIVKGLRKIFRLLKMGDKSFIDYTGHELDVNAYVENFIKGTNLNRSYENIQRDHGASIVVSIDGSGSMDYNDRIITARKLVATLIDSVAGIPNIEIRGNVWSSDSSGEIGITEIKNIQDVKMISVHTDYMLTPTHAGLEYSMEMLRTMKGSNKLVILITDGVPNYRKNYSDVSTQAYLKTCRRSLQKLLKVTPNVLCVSVTAHESANERLFGKKRIIAVRNMQDASEKIVKEFRKFIVKNVVNPF